jgi:hypothetical protein
MAINFSDNPVNGQTITVGLVVYTYNSTKQYWRSLSAPVVSAPPVFISSDYLMLMGIQ